MNRSRIGNSPYNSFTTFCFDDINNRFICITHDNLLLEMDSENFDLRYVNVEKGIELLNNFLAYDSIFYNEMGFFFSYTGTEYLVYDTRNGTISKHLFLGETAVSDSERSNVLDVIRVKSEIYVFLRNNNIIYKIDSISGNVIEKKKYCTNEMERWAAHCSETEFIIQNDKIYTCDYKDGQMTFVRDIVCHYPIQHFFVDENGFVILTCNGEIITANEYGEQNIIKVGFSEDELSILLRVLDTIWVFPKHGDNIYRIKNGVVEEYDDYNEGFYYLASEEWYKQGYKYINYITTNSKVFFPLRVGNMICVIDAKNGEMEWHQVNMPKKSEHAKMLIKCNVLLSENDECDLRSFIEAVTDEGRGNL